MLQLTLHVDAMLFNVARNKARPQALSPSFLMLHAIKREEGLVRDVTHVSVGTRNSNSGPGPELCNCDRQIVLVEQLSLVPRAAIREVLNTDFGK